MKERNFQTQFGHWLKANFKESAAFELKSVKGSSCPFNAVQPHQIQALEHVKHGMLYHKIPDVGFQNPFDCFCLYNADAFVVIRYGSGRFFGIDIDDFVEQSKESDRKSLTEDRAKLICSFHD